MSSQVAILLEDDLNASVQHRDGWRDGEIRIFTNCFMFKCSEPTMDSAHDDKRANRQAKQKTEL